MHLGACGVQGHHGKRTDRGRRHNASAQKQHFRLSLIAHWPEAGPTDPPSLMELENAGQMEGLASIPETQL